MKVKIGKKEYDTDGDEHAARFVELQTHFLETMHCPVAACAPNRGQLVAERNALAEHFGVKWHTLPRPVRPPEPMSSSFSQM